MKDSFLIFKITCKGATSHPGWQYPQFPPLTCWCFRLPFFLVRVEHQYFPSGSFLKLKIEIGSGKSSSYKNVIDLVLRSNYVEYLRHHLCTGHHTIRHHIWKATRKGFLALPRLLLLWHKPFLLLLLFSKIRFIGLLTDIINC